MNMLDNCYNFGTKYEVDKDVYEDVTNAVKKNWQKRFLLDRIGRFGALGRLADRRKLYNDYLNGNISRDQLEKMAKTGITPEDSKVSQSRMLGRGTEGIASSIGTGASVIAGKLAPLAAL